MKLKELVSLLKYDYIFVEDNDSHIGIYKVEEGKAEEEISKFQNVDSCKNYNEIEDREIEELETVSDVIADIYSAIEIKLKEEM